MGKQVLCRHAVYGAHYTIFMMQMWRQVSTYIFGFWVFASYYTMWLVFTMFHLGVSNISTNNFCHNTWVIQIKSHSLVSRAIKTIIDDHD